uniref:NADH-ubiquinone oxidoreductase chain 5 n=1 Tax=Vazella pourtalesii TaxID=2710537 RepID=A0A0N7AIA2_VAZPO|nr:NADH dehydrogenase subunit 5 [Vazella pourtalesii]AJD76731.1 NADH dehydrogenase subunit 5 [Vazella pourtalesii]
MYLLTISTPLIGFFLTFINQKKIKTTTIQILACIIIFFTWINSIIILYECTINDTHCQTKIINWIEIEYISSKISLHTNTLSSSMLFIITSISLFVHIYSLQYMNEDPHKHRFISYLSLFTFFMIILVCSNNFILLLIGWEGVGICSYLLINFWYTRTQANKSGIKAIIINRIGDIALLISTIIIIKSFGSTKFENLTHIQHKPHTQYIINSICLLLLIAAIGKSSLIGLHIWLPDAMEGPTPISALIHAATMVTAGIFLLIRSSCLLEESKISLIITAWIGTTTAFFAATIGVSQNDIKRIIAYSTCSQLGYMALAIGISKYSISLLHLINHAFFKSLLFLGAGIAIHTIKNEQDIRKLSSLIKQTPLTYIGLITASLTITGTPFLTAYFSKDLIIESTYKNSIIYWLALITAALTAFYSTRLIYFSFLKNPQYNITHAISKTSESNKLMNSIIIILTLMSISTGYITYTTLIQEAHPIIPQKLILLPLLCSILATIIIITTYPQSKISKSKSSVIIKNFTSNAWNFNTFYNNIIAEKIINIAYSQSYKNTDKGLIEEIINNTAIKKIITESQNLSKFQTSQLHTHLLTLILFYTSFAIYT